MTVRVEHAAWMIGEASLRFTKMPPFTPPSIQKIDSRKETVVHPYNENALWRRKTVSWQLKTSLGLKVGYQGRGEGLLLAEGRERARQLSRRKNEGRIRSNCYRHHAKVPKARKTIKLWHVTATEINSVWLNSWIFLFCSGGGKDYRLQTKHACSRLQTRNFKCRLRTIAQAIHSQLWTLPPVV